MPTFILEPGAVADLLVGVVRPLRRALVAGEVPTLCEGDREVRPCSEDEERETGGRGGEKGGGRERGRARKEEGERALVRQET